MAISGALRRLAGAVDELESAGVEVTGVTNRREEALDDGEMAMRFAVRVPFLDGVDEDDGVTITPEGASVAEDGTIAVDLAVSVSVEGDGDVSAVREPNGSTAEPASGRDESDEVPPAHHDPEALRTVYEEYDSFAEMTEALGADVAPNTVRRNMIKEGIHDPVASGDDAGEPSSATDADDPDDDVPAYKDPEALRAVYDEHDSFAEMTDALDVDVSPQTVRRHMIERGIHEPETADGDDEADDGSDAPDEVPEDPDAAETPLADGIDLPDDVSLDDLKETVRSARTVHEVQRRLGTDRERTRRLLRELGLLDLVTGRLSGDDREVTTEEIEERIRRATPTG